MTSVTNKIISDAEDYTGDYKFQLMYMPMNTPIFHNDGFSEVVGSLLPLVFLGVLKLSDQTI